MRMIWVRFAAALFFVSCILYLPSFGVGITDLGLENFYMDIGARPQGMGRTFVGVANDGNSCFYNPGGLPWSKGITVFAKNSQSFAAAQAYPTGLGSTVGITLVQNSLSNFLTTTGQTINFSNNIIILSTGYKLAQNIGIGANIKAIFSQNLIIPGAFDRTANGWEMDAGLMFKPIPWISLGLTGQNIMPAGTNGGIVRWDNGDLEPVPAIFLAGISTKLIGDVNSPIYLEGNELTINADTKSLRSGTTQTLFGVEWNYRGALYLRAGTSSVGAGLRQGGWGLDVASYLDPLTNANSVTFSILYDPADWTFEKKPEEKKFEKISISDPISEIYPAEESTTYDDSIQVSGKVKPGVAVQINGQSALVDPAGKFTAQVPLNPGKNLILIDLSLGDGKDRITRKILKKPKIIFSEQSQHQEELKTKTEALVTMGVVDVKPNTEFKLEAPVTRGELASWLVKAANLPLPRVTSPVFSDVQPNHPFAPFIKSAVENNLMQGIGSKFYPDSAVTKSEAQEIFTKFGAIK